MLTSFLIIAHFQGMELVPYFYHWHPVTPCSGVCVCGGGACFFACCYEPRSFSTFSKFQLSSLLFLILKLSHLWPVGSPVLWPLCLSGLNH